MEYNGIVEGIVQLSPKGVGVMGSDVCMSHIPLQFAGRKYHLRFVYVNIVRQRFIRLKFCFEASYFRLIKF